MKKIGLIALALVLSLGLVGAGFAYWTETLGIDANVETGELGMEFVEGFFWEPPFLFPGTDDDGIGLLDNGKDIDHYLAGIFPVRGDMDVGCCDIVMADVHTYTLTLDNVYPGYMVKVWWAMENTGTIPAKIQSVDIVNVTDDDGVMPYVWAGGKVSIQKKAWGLFDKYDRNWFNCGFLYSNPGLLSDMPGALESALSGYVLQPGWRVFVGCDDEQENEDEHSLLLVIDPDAPDSIEGSTLTFTLEMTWTQFNA